MVIHTITVILWYLPFRFGFYRLFFRQIFAVTLKHFPEACYQELVPSLASPCQNPILPNITIVKSCKYEQVSRFAIGSNNWPSMSSVSDESKP